MPYTDGSAGMVLIASRAIFSGRSGCAILSTVMPDSVPQPMIGEMRLTDSMPSCAPECQKRLSVGVSP